MSGETCLDIDFSFSDILSKIDDCSSIANVKRAESNGNLNSFHLSFSDIHCNDLLKDLESDYLEEDLSALIETCHVNSVQPSNGISLSALANNHFSKNLSCSLESKPEKCPPSPVASSLKDIVSCEIGSFDFLGDILCGGKFENDRLSSFDSLLSSSDSDCLSDDNSAKSKPRNEIEINNENDLNELIPDIDLSFCVKKERSSSNEEEVSPFSSSPISYDSGIDVTDFTSKEFSNSSDEASSSENSIENDYVPPSVLTSTKSSLLSKAISAQLKIDESRKEKLRNIRKELIESYFPRIPSEFKQQKLQNCTDIIDNSDYCALTSNFITIPDQQQ